MIPASERKDEYLGTLKDDTVAVNLSGTKLAEYSSLYSAVNKATGNDTILIVRDCVVDRQISLTKSGTMLTIQASWPVTVSRADDYTGNLFVRNGNCSTTFADPITIDGKKVESDDSAEWAYTSALFNVSGGVLVIGSGVTLNNRNDSSMGTRNGGAISAYGGSVVIEEGVKITDCEAKTSGGAIYLRAYPIVRNEP